MSLRYMSAAQTDIAASDDQHLARNQSMLSIDPNILTMVQGSLGPASGGRGKAGGPTLQEGPGGGGRGGQ